MNLSAERWEGAATAEREALAKRLASQLPNGFTFHAIRNFRLGEAEHEVALFRLGDATFALIPGAVVNLGYDIERAWVPNADELDSWRETSEEYGITKTIVEHISDATLRIRRVEIWPFLIETAAGELVYLAKSNHA